MLRFAKTPLARRIFSGGTRLQGSRWVVSRGNPSHLLGVGSNATPSDYRPLTTHAEEEALLMTAESALDRSCYLTIDWKSE